MNRNLVGITYGRFCIKFPQSRMKAEPLVFNKGCHGRDCMVVGFTTTYAISAYYH
jgi:hypothetical protein